MTFSTGDNVFLEFEKELCRRNSFYSVLLRFFPTLNEFEWDWWRDPSYGRCERYSLMICDSFIPQFCHLMVGAIQVNEKLLATFMTWWLYGRARPKRTRRRTAEGASIDELVFSKKKRKDSEENGTKNYLGVTSWSEPKKTIIPGQRGPFPPLSPFLFLKRVVYGWEKKISSNERIGIPPSSPPLPTE